MIEERMDFLARHRRRTSPKNCSKAVLQLSDALDLHSLTIGKPSPHIRRHKSSLGAQRTPFKTSISPLNASKYLPKTPTTVKSAHPGYQTFTDFLSQPRANRANTSDCSMSIGRRRSNPDIHKGLAAVLSLCDDFSDLPRPHE